MNIIHLTCQDYKTARWSGGTTTELFLWPEDGSYASRDFAVRISSATVELPESDFTALPGVQRFITPLHGSFTLSHEDGKPIPMGPLDAPYGFSGGRATHCVGTATDFNLMLKGVSGTMEIAREKTRLTPGMVSLYATEDAVFSLKNEKYPMKTGDLLLIFTEKEEEIFLGPASVIVCRAEIEAW